MVGLGRIVREQDSRLPRGGALPEFGDGQGEAEFAVHANLERVLRGSSIG